jgi:hypothetical protein
MTGGSGRRYDDQGYDDQAHDGHGYDEHSYNGQGYNGQGYNEHGYNGQGYNEHGYNGHGYNEHGYNGQGYNGQGYATQAENGQAQNGQWYGTQAYEAQRYGEHNGEYTGQAHNGQSSGGQGYDGQAYDGQGYNGQGYNGQGYDGQGYGPQGYDGQGYNGHGASPQGYAADRSGGQGQGYADQPTRQYGGYGDQSAAQYGGYGDQPTRQNDGYADQQDRYRDPRGGQGYDGQRYDSQGYAGYNGYQEQQGYVGEEYGAGRGRPGQGQGQGRGSQRGLSRRRPGPDADPGASGQRKVRFRRLRRFSRRRSVRVVAAIFSVFLVWVMFSAGQAAFKNNGQGFTANLAEWARDHYLGPIVTFGEWLSYNPPKTGGKPSFSYAVPKGEQVTQTKGKHKGFVPDIPPTVKLLATGAALPGEGQWRVVEKVKGEPAILITFLRDGGQYTSYSNGIASIDQRLVKFSLRPGTEDPGAAPGDGGNWGVPNYVPPSQRTGVLATFNGGFKLDAAAGGFYLNGMYHGSLVNGAASIVYYKNGTVKIGEWGRDFSMNSSIEGVRQNLRLLVDHGTVTVNANLAVNTSFGATLGGGYWVWRSGIGITKDGRIIFVYGQALDAQDLGRLLKQAGAVEGMQMDINPEWMKFDYYQANGHPSDPTPVPLLPNQQATPYSYYTPSTRDFTAVYAR